jgi:DNA-binding response OmpR family regulator
MRLLIIEDADRLRENLRMILTRMGNGVDAAGDGEEGAMMARQNFYDVILLDYMLPGQDGVGVLQELRRDGVDTPVLMLTALDGTEEKVRALSAGADDYLTKPFVLAELGARLEALARRRYGMVDSTRTIGPLEIDICQKAVKRDGESILLTAREFSVLEILARRPGRVMSREQIEQHLYSETDCPQSNAVDATIYLLRRKLCPPGTPPLIHTRRGLGYVLEAG